MYILSTEPQLSMVTHMGNVYYCDNVYLLRNRSEYTCVSVMYCGLDLVSEAMHCKAKHVINLKPYPIILDPGDIILFMNLQKAWM